MNRLHHIVSLAATAIALGSIGAAAPASAAQIFNFGDFSGACGGSQLTCVGSTGTTTTGDGSVLRLTTATGGQAGAAYSTTAVTLGSSATFSTTFQFRFTSTPGNNGIDPADGIVFVLSNSPSGLGSQGAGIGYSGSSVHSVGIEFDTFNDDDRGYYNTTGIADASSNHVAIDTGGILTNTDSTNVYGVSNCTGAGGYTNTTNTNTYLSPGCMANGDLWTVTIGYDGSKNQLSVSMQDGSTAVDNIITGYSLSTDLATLLGTDTAYVGFTSGTGAGWENHDIKDWSLNSDLALVTPPTTPTTPTGVPEPMSLTLLGIGAAGLAATRRRRGKPS